jgi:nucleoside triphosphatase
MKTRNVAILLLENDGKILLQKRSMSAKRFAGQWGLFGGGIEEGETPEQGLRREISEELNLKLKSVRQIHALDYTLDCTAEKGTIFTFYSKYHGEKLDLNEGDEMKWVPFDETMTYNLSPDYKKILEHISQNREVMVL